jgi:hypothetical protein
MQTIEVQCEGKLSDICISFSGGMKVKGEDDKKKTPGGVFMALIKKSPE